MIRTIDPIFKALEGLHIASKYNDIKSIKYQISKCDDLDITNYAQNICMCNAAADKMQGTNNSDIYKVIEQAGERLTGRCKIYESILIS